jgi:hypothetical protein
MREAIPPLFQYAFMAWCLVKHKDFKCNKFMPKRKLLLLPPPLAAAAAICNVFTIASNKNCFK